MQKTRFSSGNKNKVAHWTLSPCYLLVLGISVQSQASPLYERQSHPVMLASFDTELHKPSALNTPAAAAHVQANLLPYQRWQRSLLSNPDDAEALAGLTRHYAQLNQMDVARRYLARLKKTNDKYADIPALENLVGLPHPALPVSNATKPPVPVEAKPRAAAAPAEVKPRLAATPAKVPPEPQTGVQTEPLPTSPEISAQMHLKLAAQLGAAGKQPEFVQAMTKIEPLAIKNSALTGDIARVWIKNGRSDRAAVFLENSGPLDPVSTVLYAWALLHTEQDDKLTNLLVQIDARKLGSPANQPRLLRQLTEIRQRHVAHQELALRRKQDHPTAVGTGQQTALKNSGDAPHTPAQASPAAGYPEITLREDLEKTKLAQKIADLRNGASMTYEMQDYQRAHAMLLELETLGEKDRDLLMLRAWDEFNLSNYQESGKRFASLYQGSPDKQSAEGLFYSYTKLNRTGELRGMVREHTLSDLLNKSQLAAGPSQSGAASDSDFLANRRAGREKYDPFATLGISNADIYFSQRSKTGENGTSRLISRKEPSVAYGWRSEDNSTDYRIQVDRVTLNSGVLDPALAIVGSDAAYGGIPTPLPQKTAMSGFEPLLIARHEAADATYTGELGLTPSGGAVSGTLTGRVNALKYLSWGTAAIDGYMQPVRDSILSYTGMNDPYAAVGPWGRVIRTGIAPSVSWKMNEKWSLSSSATLEGLSGVNTRNNYHYGVRAAVGYSFDVTRFEYLSADISASYDHFQNNQNLFTYGNGGYYSPQSSVNVGPSVTFLTRNFYPVVLNGRASFGYGRASTDNALRFPLDPANPANVVAPGAGFYSSVSQGMNYNFAVQALWNVTRDLQLGCSVAYSQADASAPAFKENNLSFFARIPFDGIVK